MSRLFLLALLLAPLLLSPHTADARAGLGRSVGSRGSRTYVPPPPTATAPSAAPIEPAMPPYYRQPGAPFAPPPFSAPRPRSFFTSGVMGGLFAAGLVGALLGYGMFGGLTSISSALGLFIQLALLVLLLRVLLQFLFRPKPAPGPSPMLGMGRAPPPGQPIVLVRSDYQAFESLLGQVQAAWTAQDGNTMRQLATPEMVKVLGDQLAALRASGHRNTVTDVKLQQGDLAEAWTEGGKDYATVAMRYSMIDVTRDQRGYVVDGSPDEHVSVTELWTFTREKGGAWMLSAIQQAR